MLEKAISIALEAHSGQVDKGGQPYIFHPLRLMLQMPTEQLQVIAVLHDVIEDSEYSSRDLKESFTVEIIEALQSLTKNENEDYFDFIHRVKANKLATKVKIADLVDNSNLNRIANPTQEDMDRVEKYKQALEILEK